MAQRFSFGQNISGAVGNTLQRNQQAQQFAQQLNRRLRQDAINNKIRSLAQRIQARRVDLEEERMIHKMAQDAIANAQRKEELEFRKEEAERRAKAREEARKESASQGSDTNQGAVSIEIQSLVNETRKDRERLNELKGVQGQIFETGVVPSELAGEFGEANPTNVLFSVTNQIMRTQKQLERKQDRLRQLQEKAGTAPPQQETPEGNNNNSAPLDTL